MSILKRPRDLKLLDALDKLERIAVNDNVWRVVREARDPLVPHSSGGRWDPGLFDVLYTSFDPDGAIAEMHFQLSSQPVFPSKVKFSLSKISVQTKTTLKFANLQSLSEFCINEKNYSTTAYEATQLIGDAAAFLGFDGIIAPNARWNCLNLVIFTNSIIDPNCLEILESTETDIEDWNKSRKNA